MLKFRIENMSCGHCQLKVSSTLNEHGYDVEYIDMDLSEVKVKGTKEDHTKIVQLLDQIGYMVDNDSFVFLNHYIVSSDKFEDENIFDQFLSYLTEEDCDIENINDDLSVVIHCSERDFQKILTFLELL